MMASTVKMASTAYEKEISIGEDKVVTYWSLRWTQNQEVLVQVRKRISFRCLGQAALRMSIYIKWVLTNFCSKLTKVLV